MYNVILCGYRDWSIKINEYVASLDTINCIHMIRSKEEYDKIMPALTFNSIDFMLFIGWSWIIKEDVLNKCLCLGIHPSDLPFYRGGSPIQHQIIDGIIDTKITLMSLSSEKIDAGDIYAKENVSLSGNNMNEVFEHIIESSKLMLYNFITNYDKIKPQKQSLKNGSYYKRRTPHESSLSFEIMSGMTLEQIYNFMRALTDPYPNAYIEDNEGNRLVFKQVEYIPKHTPIG
jgi:methionyl-tRNA formyltransferase